MARFNIRPRKAQPASPVTTTGRVLRTHQGGRGHERDARSELFLLSVAVGLVLGVATATELGSAVGAGWHG